MNRGKCQKPKPLLPESENQLRHNRQGKQRAIQGDSFVYQWCRAKSETRHRNGQGCRTGKGGTILGLLRDQNGMKVAELPPATRVYKVHHEISLPVFLLLASKRLSQRQKRVAGCSCSQSCCFTPFFPSIISLIVTKDQISSNDCWLFSFQTRLLPLTSFFSA